MEHTRPRKVLVIGAGPVGAFTAISLHRRGWDVEIWESRSDPRWKEERMGSQRSINLAMSSRGLEALRSVDPSLAELFLSEAIPMRGRMIHHANGQEESQVYDPKRGQCINSISRSLFNQRLLEALSPSIKTRFNTKLSHIDFRSNRAWGISVQVNVQPGQEAEDSRAESSKDARRINVDEVDEHGTPFDLIIGCDGGWSKVRNEMTRVERIDFSQSYIQHAYIELHMPADPLKPGGHAMDPNHLHIWPQHKFMLIGLPNKDGSFTLTLFLPFPALQNIPDRQAASKFFNENFPGAVEIVGEKRLLDDFEKNPRGTLVTINTNPTTWSSHGLLLGDASHSMVPFFGQGLNCGLEDVRVINSCLERHGISPSTSAPIGEKDENLASALSDYSTHRHEDLLAICDLALHNYSEMRSHVLSPMHHLRRHIDSILSTIFPSKPTSPLSLIDPFPTSTVTGWTSLYEMVTFRPDVRYSEARRREEWQKDTVRWMGWTSGVGLLTGLGVYGVYGLKVLFRRRRML